MAPDRSRPTLPWRLLPVAAVLLFATVLRAPLTVVPPMLGLIRADLGLDAATAGLLTSIPVLCFGLLTPVASRLLSRVGINLGAVYCAVGIIVATVVRSLGGTGWVFAGTVLLGITLAIGNLAVPMLIGRQFRHRAELLTGAYALTTNIVVTATTALAVPVALVVGWRATAASTGVVLGIVVLAVWVAVYSPGEAGARPWIRRRAGHPELSAAAAHTEHASSPTRRRLTVLVSVAFACHTFAYYVMTSWLPTALAELEHMTPSAAGAGASVFQASGVAGPILVPFLAAIRWPSRRIIVVMGLAWILMPAGMLVAHSWWVLWSLFGGLAQAGFFTAVMSVVIRQSRSVDENRRTTTVMQTVGYSVAALGPFITGWIHQHVAGWTVPFATVLAVTVVMLVAAVLAVRPPSTAEAGSIA
jgi:MFS transporter, CP family, cyanate transporter